METETLPNPSSLRRSLKSVLFESQIWSAHQLAKERAFSATAEQALCAVRRRSRYEVDIETQGSCRLQVDHELELGPLLHRQVGWFCPFEDFVDEAGRAVPHVFDASTHYS
jgi:hypothetical protein